MPCACPERCQKRTSPGCTASDTNHMCCAVPRPATQRGAGSECMAGERRAGPAAFGGGHHEAVQQAGPPQDGQPAATPLGGPGGRPCMAYHDSCQRACQQTWRNGVHETPSPTLSMSLNVTPATSRVAAKTCKTRLKLCCISACYLATMYVPTHGNYLLLCAN